MMKFGPNRITWKLVRRRHVAVQFRAVAAQLVNNTDMHIHTEPLIIVTSALYVRDHLTTRIHYSH